MLTRPQLEAAATLTRVDLDGYGPRLEGKVRDMYVVGDRRVLITTDRVSAFDRVLGAIPCKGQVLTQLSRFWFEQTADLVANHMIEVPDPNVMITREAAPLPVEVVVRGYITGSTSTALWTLYERGEPRPYGLELPAGLKKNDPLPRPVITPTTKAARGEHDERLTSAEVVERGLVSPALWAEVERVAVAVFLRGQELARRAGLILVDTKYEFGLIDGELVLIDEIHTPDSSRYWVADTYEARVAEGQEPESFDKEFLRLWFVGQGYRGEGAPPSMPVAFVAQVAERYIAAYERLTGQTFEPGRQPAAARIASNLQGSGLAGQRASVELVVPIIMGSKADLAHAERIVAELSAFGIGSEVRVASAHKATAYVLALLKAYEADGRPKVYITVAGRSNSLSGVVDANVQSPVLACPPYSDTFGGADVFSSLRMPSGVVAPVVLEPEAAALLAAKILALADPTLRGRVAAFQARNTEKIIEDDLALNWRG